MILLAVLSGCGGPAPVTTSSTPPAPAAAEAPQAAVADFVLPLDQYWIGATAAAVIRTARDRQATRCLATQGIAWTPATVRRRPELEGNARRYGVIDAGTARRYGYHVPPADEPAQQLPQAQAAKLEACKAAADKTLRAGVAKGDEGWLDQLSFASMNRSAVAPGVVRATEAWSRCMKAARFGYPDPMAAVSDPHWQLDSPEISPTEIAVATADVRCKEKTRLVAVRAKAESAIQEQAIAATPARFSAIAQANTALLTNANAMLTN